MWECGLRWAAVSRLERLRSQRLFHRLEYVTQERQSLARRVGWMHRQIDSVSFVQEIPQSPKWLAVRMPSDALNRPL